MSVIAPAPPMWLEGLGDWSWPGSAASAAEHLPPQWVPTRPRPHLPARPAPAPAPIQPRRFAARRLLALALILTGATFVLLLAHRRSPPAVYPTTTTPARAALGPAARPTPRPTPALPPASVRPLIQDAAGARIEAARYASVALHGRGSFLVYLPPGFVAADRRYPVLYLLHGNGQQDSSFLTLGVPRMLDALIAGRQIAPLIAVMIQGGPGPNNWRDGRLGRYEAYVLEVQELVDRLLPTVADRSARAIAGYSMGGYGAMNIALSHLDRFSIAQSWLGFFAGLADRARADRSELAQQPLRTFVYGGAQDTVADTAGDLPFASAMRSAGAEASGAVYPGDHSFATLHAHLGHMLLLAGRALHSAP